RAVCAVQIAGWLDRDMLQKTLRLMVERHEILRTVFYALPGMEMPVQVVADSTAWFYSLVSLEDLDAACQLAKIDEMLAALQEEVFDLEHGPVLYSCLLSLAADRHMLIIGLPALCADGATLKLFIDELLQTYTTCLRNEEPGEEPLQYADVAAW